MTLGALPAYSPRRRRAAPVSRRLVEDLRNRLGVETVESYGLTEISPLASVQAPSRAQKRGS